MCNERESENEILKRSVNLTRLWKVAGLPACVYLCFSLVMPAVNGAALGGDALKDGFRYGQHAITTVLTLVLLIAVLFGLDLVYQWLVKKFAAAKIQIAPRMHLIMRKRFVPRRGGMA